MTQSLLREHLEGVRRGLADLDLDAVSAVVAELLAVRRRRGRVFTFGNGGSAALASHVATDLSLQSRAPGRPALSATALGEDRSTLTALANDAAYEAVFAEQLRIHCRPGDLAFAVSCSGASPNVLAGVRTARELGARTVALSGASGGSLAELADVCVCAPAATIEQQEDIHLALHHAITRTLRGVIAEAGARAARPWRALVLAAGQGTRLLPLTRDRPKAMLPVAGRPLIEHILCWLRDAGVCDVAINLHHRGDALATHLRDGSALGVRLHYSHERTIRGTAGAVRELDGFLVGSPLLIVYGDVLTDLDLRALYHAHSENVALDPSTAATLALVPAADPTRVGLVAVDGRDRVARFVEKPAAHEVFDGLANAGVMVLEPWVVDRIPPDTFCDFGEDLFPGLLAEGVTLYGCRIASDAYLVDVGTPETYDRAQREWPLRAARAAARVRPC